MTGELDSQRTLVALGCRVAAARDLVDGMLGHLSLRVDHDRLLVRCRSDSDKSVIWLRLVALRL